VTTDNTETIARVFRDHLDQPRWVEWRPVQRKSGKVDKVPYTPGTSRKAATNDPEIWRAFDQCRSERRGWCFQDGDDLAGVDLDGCRDPAVGVLAPWAMELVRDFNSYAEVSPSGTGVHIFAAGAPSDFRFSSLSMPSAPVAGKEPKVEAFATLGHFLTVTGDRLPEAPEEIRAAPEAWARLLRRREGERGSGGGGKADNDRHHALLFLARRLRMEGKSDDDIRAEVNAANRADNTDLHPEFATKGAADQKQVDRIIKWALNKVEHDDRVIIELRASELDAQVSAAEDALVTTSKVFRQADSRLVNFSYEPADATRGRTTAVARIRPYDTDWLVCELSARVRCVRWDQGTTKRAAGWVTVDLPGQLVRSLLAKASAKFSDLAGVIETPTLRPDGSLLATPGYDPATGLMLVNPPPMPVIPDRPTRAEAEAALALLDDLLVEFPFVDEPSHSVALSGLITPVVRPAVEHAPLHEAAAPAAGSGKSYWADLAAAIGTGRICPVLGATDANRGDRVDKVELDKRLTGALLSGQALISIDNVSGSLGSSLLCQMLSQQVVQVRILGATGNPHLGRADPVETQEGLAEDDPKASALDAVMEAWAEAQQKVDPNKSGKPYIPPDAWLTAKELADCYPLNEALRGATFARELEFVSAVKVGQFLKRYRGRIRKGMGLTADYDGKRKVWRWRLSGWREFLAAREGDERSTDTGPASTVVSLPAGEQRRSGRPATKRMRAPRDD
jgi:hypothetical protein